MEIMTIQETNIHAKGKPHAQTTMNETPSPYKTHSTPFKYLHRKARTKRRKAIILPCKPKLIQNQSSKLMNNKKAKTKFRQNQVVNLGLTAH